MKKILVFLFITISFGCIAQKLVQLEPCKDQYGNPKDSCFIMSGLPTGHGRWIDIDLLRQIIGSPDSIPSGVICSSLGGIPTGTVATGDHFIVKSATGCKRVPFNLIVSPLALCAAAQATANGVYDTDDKVLYLRPDGSCYKDTIHWSAYGGLDCPGVLDCISSDPSFCTEVQNCINSTYICQTLNDFGGMNFVPDYLIGIENGICAKVDGNLFGSAAICSNLNLLQYSAAPDTVFGTFQGQCYKVKLPTGGTNWNCDSTKNCLSQQWFCDSVTNCLNGFLCDSIKACLNTFLCDSIIACVDGFLCDSIISCIQNDTTICDLFLECLDNPKFDTLVCEALHTFPYQAPGNTGDTVIAVSGGICYKTLASSGGGGSSFNCDSAKLCVLGSPEFCDSVEACLVNGNLFCPWFVNLDPLGINEGDYFPFVSGGSCWKSTLEFVNTNPTCLTVGLSDGTITSTLTLKSDGGLTCTSEGLAVDVCPFFATLPAPVPYAGQALIGQDCNTYTVDVNIDCNKLGALFSPGGALASTDLILTRSGGSCTYKTLNLSGIPNCNGNILSGPPLAVWGQGEGGVCAWFDCSASCLGQDINPLLPKMQKEIENLKNENKELRKLITEIQKKLK